MSDASQKKTSGKRPPKKIGGAFKFADLNDQEPPKLRMEIVDRSGKRASVKISDTNEFELDSTLVGTGARIEIRALEGGGPVRRFQYDTFFDAVQQAGLYQVPEPAWRQWVWYPICVTGKVVVCRPYFFWQDWLVDRQVALPTALSNMRRELLEPQSVASIASGLMPELVGPIPIFPLRCEPVCHGKVEVFLRTCCCEPFVFDPPRVIEHICELLGCPPEPWPPIPWPPEPIPRPDPPPWLDRITQLALKRAVSVEGAPPVEEVLRLSQHLSTLTRLPYQQQIEYIQTNHDLLWGLCHCGTKKVAEVVLQPDGHFDACWPGPLFPPFPGNCTYRVLYRVSQLQGDSWIVVYDGLAQNQSFGLGDNAVLHADWQAQTCDEPPEIPDNMTPFVLLERIGGTWADNLIRSTDQNGETTFAGPLGLKDGLVNERPAGIVSPTSGPYDQPWGKTLSLRFQFHPDLEGLGAKFYRVRVVRIGDNGQLLPGSTPFTLTNGVSWRKYFIKPDGSVGAEWVSLNNPAINGVEGLYTIPYPDLAEPWLGGQFHAHITTDQIVGGSPLMPNGRYLFVVDLFDAAGHRLVPTNSLQPAGPGEHTLNFEYLRLNGPLDADYANTSVVPHSALSNLFWVDNLACFADIEAIVHDGVPSSANCQFLDGKGSDQLSLQYSAYHSNDFQWYHRIRYKQGLTGPTTWLPASNATVNSGNSPSRTFEQMLGDESKCSFSATLYARARHTNGFGRILAYDAEDYAAFALEKQPGNAP